jgi:hypothetical protein
VIVSTLGASYVRPHVPVLLSSLRESLIRGARSRLFCLEALRARALSHRVLSAIASAFGEELAQTAVAARGTAADGSLPP